MAKRRKATSRAKAGAPAADPAASGSVHDEDTAVETKEDESGSDTSETCPVCERTPRSGVQDRTWVMCEACEIWYHASCVDLTRRLDTVDKWYCADCIAKDASRVITFKAPARKSTRTTNKVDYANLNDGIAGDPRRWFRHLNQKPMKKSHFKRMKGSDVSLEWLQNDETAMTEPIIIESPEGLGMKMPPHSFTVNDVARLVGPKEKVEVLDVASQREDKGWTLQSWADYYNKPASEREKIRNVISLEISETKLAEKISPPRLVREIDWVEHMWPAAKRKANVPYPKVQMYCLMSVAECWTDWHLDFAGSSVYYHILKGSKIFYFIKPTPSNLAAYEKWSGNENYQASVWLGDWVDEVIKVELKEGNTMIIPTGWIHCVYTPTDSLVFGGNFLHSWNIATQLRVRDLEIATRVPKKFRFPFFRKLCWYVAEKTLKDLKAKEEFPMRVLEGMDALATFLTRESRIMERKTSTEAARKDSKEQVPATIKDPAALAREFRWRVRLAAGHDSGDELESPFHKTTTNGASSSANGSKRGSAAASKRKRGGGGADEREPGPRFKGFIPRNWDTMSLRKIEEGVSDEVDVPALPTADDGLEWFDSLERRDADTDTAMDGGASSHRAKRARTTDEVVKLRRTLGKGGEVVAIERETIRRVYESWTFSGAGVAEKSEEDAPVDVVGEVKLDVVDGVEVKPTLAAIAADAMDITADAPEVALDPPPDTGLLKAIAEESLAPATSMDHESVADMLVDAGFTSTAASV